MLSFAAGKDDDDDVDDDDDEDEDTDGDDDVSWAHIERLAVFAPCCCKAASTLRCGLVCLYHVGSCALWLKAAAAHLARMLCIQRVHKHLVQTRPVAAAGNLLGMLGAQGCFVRG